MGSPPARRNTAVAAAIAFVVLVGVVALASRGGSQGAPPGAGGLPPPDPRVEAAGLSARLPPGWRAVDAYQPPQITTPVARLAFASGPVRHARTGCHVGAYVIPADSAMVVVLEWPRRAVRPGGDLLAPSRLSTRRLRLYRPGIECFAGRGGAVRLVDGRRVFAAYLMLGDRAAPATVAQSLSAIRSLRAAGQP